MQQGQDARNPYKANDTVPLLLREKWSRTNKLLIILALLILIAGGMAILVWLLITAVKTSHRVLPNPPFELVNRTTWGARKANKSTPLPTQPATRVVILHTVTEQCTDLKECCAQVRQIQAQQMDHSKFDDIGYSFLIGSDGRTYEGRGWDIRGAFATLLNNKALGIAFIGNFEHVTPNQEQLTEAQKLLAESVANKKLTPDYKLVGHRQVQQTSSPGQKLYDIIKTWPHWEECYKETC